MSEIFTNYDKGFKFLFSDNGKEFIHELDGIQLAYDAWGETNFFNYTTFPKINIGNTNICAFAFIPPAYMSFTVNVKEQGTLRLSRIILFPQIFCGNISSLASKYNDNQEISFQKLYNAIYMPLKVLHDKGIVHNDIKMDNIVECDGTYKLIDFGLTKKIDDSFKRMYIPGMAHPATNEGIIDVELNEVFTSYGCEKRVEKPYVVNDMFNFFIIFALFKLKHKRSATKMAKENAEFIKNTTFKTLMGEACMFPWGAEGGQSTTLSKLYNKYCVHSRKSLK